MNLEDGRLNVILMVGVNGVGKTTTIGKLAHRYKMEGKKVMLAAGDTFRAGAIDQLQVWGDRVGVICFVNVLQYHKLIYRHLYF
jgi:fused signal recognition particle receptor